jgi:predicted Zn-ribbon and HTH transcriptional regulator
MTVYQYKCKYCGYHWHDTMMDECPECQTQDIEIRSTYLSLF